MPWLKSFYADMPDKYIEPLFEFYDGMIDYLIEKKKQHTKDRELFLSYQKKFGESDREIGKFFRNHAAEEMKCYRGCCYALQLLAASPPGDCRDLQASAELAPYIDAAIFTASNSLPTPQS